MHREHRLAKSGPKLAFGHSRRHVAAEAGREGQNTGITARIGTGAATRVVADSSTSYTLKIRSVSSRTLSAHGVHHHGWQFEGALEVLMHNIGMFDTTGALDLTGFAGSGADWLDQYKEHINDGETVVASPHKV